eukprot:TRINITY_DN1317_c0_g1_i3.p1 TRINITY_DN1317_c0_g1~~TRINITY_DN1317_c0_g1_i3.p1  ORF type:complete len:171 (-),score=10.64 TRINITY_DN1317_c0_g1_i3:483-995(-)
MCIRDRVSTQSTGASDNAAMAYSRRSTGRSGPSQNTRTGPHKKRKRSPNRRPCSPPELESSPEPSPRHRSLNRPEFARPTMYSDHRGDECADTTAGTFGEHVGIISTGNEPLSPIAKEHEMQWHDNDQRLLSVASLEAMFPQKPEAGHLADEGLIARVTRNLFPAASEES